MALTGYINERDRSAPTTDDINKLDSSDINSFDRRYAGYWNTDAQKLSDILLYGGALTPLAMIANKKNDYVTLGVMYLETLVLTGGGMAMAKGSVTRYRPLAYSKDAPLADKLGHDTKRSFFSGHTAYATSGFIFTAKVFSDYYPQSKYKPVVWGSAITGSLATAWLRVKGGKHFPSDVLTGFAWGAGIGYAIPLLHNKNRRFNLFPLISPYQQGIGIQKNF